MRWVFDSCQLAERQLRAQNINSEAAILAFAEDSELKNYCKDQNIPIYLPIMVPENDLIKRYLRVAKTNDFTHIIRVTADCWQTNADLICELAMQLKDSDYCSNTITRTFMEGLDLQGCSYRALEWFDENQDQQREHPFITFDRNEMIRDQFEKRFKYTELLNPRNENMIRSSVDTERDLMKAREMYEAYEDANQ